MSKVDWITWKTDPKEIINPKKIEEEINEYYHNYESYMNSMVYDQLYTEIKRGGLSKEAFHVSGISPANEMAIEIINAIDEIKETMKRLMDSVREVTANQKEIEKRQLIDAIEEKIEKEKKLLEAVDSNKDMSNPTETEKNKEDRKYIINDRIKKLYERLDIAKSL
ncbi:MAG: hypothetical protein IKF71_00605 [Bacilli bacterium]|nr:hypothetical protein [Bacilli bacterium]